jgi:hypothetical protein
MMFLMARCPTTGEVISTRVAADSSRFDTFPKVGTRMNCPVCREEHYWTSRQVWFAESTASDRNANPVKSPVLPLKQVA